MFCVPPLLHVQSHVCRTTIRTDGFSTTKQQDGTFLLVTNFISPLFITLHRISLDLCSNYYFIIYKILLAFIITGSGENVSIFKSYLLNPNKFWVDVTDCKDLLEIDLLLSKLKALRGSKIKTIKQFGKCLFVGRKEEILAKRVFTHA